MTTELKLEVLLAYENRECTIQELCKRYQITKYSLRQWIKTNEEEKKKKQSYLQKRK
ncbi:helix-turn-helix domain-containing protein [Aeribacillus composti]|uniref:helix-turn-helix domain-containing protein n=1 Tax=Aeribacillus composti TaxID=1868734 RepID=UPI00399C8D85